MINTVITLKTSDDRIQDIVNALYSANCGHEVYTALSNVPFDNLRDMQDMITYILEQD